MKLLRKIILDFGRDTLPVTVFAKQNDSQSRFLEITPLDNRQRLELEDGVTARLLLTKPDGFTVINDAVIKDGKIFVALTRQILAAAGTATAEIALYRGDAVLSSALFYINIKESAYDPDAPESADEFNALLDALGRVDGAAEKAERAVSEAEASVTNAKNAISGANAAAQAANTAAEGAEKVNISAVQTETGATITVTDKDGVETAVHIDTLQAIDSWDDVAYAVRSGLGPKLFPVGWEFETTDADTENIITWVVRGHDHHKAANDKIEHSMTLEAKYVYGNSAGTYLNLVFDAYEALYYATEELPAGTYNFTWNYATGSMVNGTYQFTLANAVPAGGQIVLGTNSSSTAITSCKIATYAAVGATAAIESGVVVSAGSEGTSLGTINSTSTSDENLNCAQRIMWGSNNYAQSAARQWLNSDAAAGSVWTPTNKFDRAPSWANSKAGFMSGLPADFLATVQPATISCHTNSVFEVNSLDGTEFTVNQVYTLKDMFFMLSRPEIYGDWDSTAIKDGELLEYYEGLTDTERKKYDAAGSVRTCWLRSDYNWSAHREHLVHTDGSLREGDALYAAGVAPACIIA